MKPNISYIIGTHNESPKYLTTLFDQILKFKDEDDEIIVVDDYSDNKETVETLNSYKDKLTLYYHKLDGDFSAHKNFMNSKATKNHIFNIDADECPHERLLGCLKEVLINNPSVEAYCVPRINIVPDITPEDMERFGWNFYSNTNHINLPDYQTRIYKNKPEILWKGKVHEQLTGFSSHTELPFLSEDGKVDPSYCLLHLKSRFRQLEQNLKYQNMQL